jgi:hypothetical protein
VLGVDLAGAKRSKAQRRERSTGQFVKRVSFTRSVKEEKPAIPGLGTGRCRQPRRQRRRLLGILFVPADLPCDEAAALIAASASELARPPGRSTATPCAPTSAAATRTPSISFEIASYRSLPCPRGRQLCGPDLPFSDARWPALGGHQLTFATVSFRVIHQA